ncbi:MAG TPA: UDP-glucose 4-epimerase GalE [Acidimicrobiales bacterium]|jgi:UDP-glucose 4-epimerase|nr:UDP-glucose 4-epimerase GalE [Acidimicrobiales bacterium]
MKLLVVGGAGYIGSVVTTQLLAAGHTVTVADNLSRGHRDAVPPGAELVEADVLDADALAAVLAPGFDAVLHFAALSLVAESVAEPTRYFRVNVGGTLNLLDAMQAAGVRRLVFSSTAAVYGEPEEVPVTEDSATRPTNPYGASKLAVDQAIGFQAAAHGLGAVSLRYFNVAGAYGPFGERHQPETHLIPLVLQAASGQRPSVNVYGTDYPTPDGTAVRDYIHVEDLAHAHLLALDATGGPGHRIYNLGNGEGFSVREVVETARVVTGREIPAVEAPRRPGDPAVLVASSARIGAELGWAPAKDLRAMVADAWGFVNR